MIDWDRVRELHDEMGSDDFEEVVELFLAEVDDALGRLAQDVTAADLHFVKGCALNIGFSTLADLCSRGERLAESGQAAQVDTAAIASAFGLAREAFLGSYRDRLAA